MDESDFKNPVWRDLVLGAVQVNLNYLAAKIMLSRWQVSIKNTPSAITVETAAREIFNLYLKDKELPSVKKDIALLLKKQVGVQTEVPNTKLH